MSTDVTPGAALRIDEHTLILRPSLCPELQLRVIDRNSPLGRAIRRHGLYAVHEVLAGLRFPPHWGYAFAGGQALARFVLDHPERVAGRRVLDIGTGSGLVAIAAARAGALRVTALDRDPLALEASRNNSYLNGFSVETEVGEIQTFDAGRFDLLLASEVFYEDDGILRWLEGPGLAGGASVLLADPGRGILMPDRARELARYRSRTEPDLEWVEQAVIYGLGPVSGHSRSV